MSMFAWVTIISSYRLCYVEAENASDKEWRTWAAQNEQFAEVKPDGANLAENSKSLTAALQHAREHGSWKKGLIDDCSVSRTLSSLSSSVYSS